MGWPDKYTKKAHSEGYAARSVYKLQDMDAKYDLLKSGHKVLDLGCYPGSFSQYISSRVGKNGFVVGLDIQKVPKKLGDNVKTFVVDVFSDDALRVMADFAPFDVVFSDMAPQTTGVRTMDQNRSADLVERAWELALKFGKPDGVAIIKYFQGAGAQKFLQGLQREGVKIKTYKPKASREQSYEMFLIARIP